MKKDDILLKLKTVKPLLMDKYGLTALALFGSYSRNEQTENSDIDIMIDLSGKNSSDFFECAFFLQDLFRDTKVEIVTREGIKPHYLEVIKGDLIYA